eukprot:Protomagalhaensia_sp_Gyna_25__2230@NODE_2213_length_1219_cov_140_998305_g1834_i0_p1_GENE_NODE_2213_length_1219_cov_140_998305_g1834_i0NODE_2213_length_1219_cov_140_998305_g1834_i0_p1_ORF_typecomplete_len298_score30_43OATP/PF03137_20/0_13_NODE_2213_length_1219_cov_140_998305_g1834_i030923
MGALLGRPSTEPIGSPHERQRLLLGPPNDFAKPPVNPALNAAIRWLPGRLIGYGCGLYSIGSALYSLQHLSVYRNQFFHDSTVTVMAPDTYTVVLDGLFSLANLVLGVSCLIGTSRQSPAWIDRSIKLCYGICASEGLVRPAVGAAVAEHGMATFSRGVTAGGAQSLLELCSKPLPVATMAYLLEKVKQHILHRQQSQVVGSKEADYGPPSYTHGNYGAGNHPGATYPHTGGGRGGYAQPDYGYQQDGAYQNERYPNAPPEMGRNPPEHHGGPPNYTQGYQPPDPYHQRYERQPYHS